MHTISFLLSFLPSLVTIQDPCENSSFEKAIESSDLVAIVSLDESSVGLLSDSIFVLNVHKVFKGRADYQFLMTSPTFAFERGVEYLVFGDEYSYLTFRLKNSSYDCFTAVELAKASRELMDFLEERWVTKCYSQELVDELRGKANTRELKLFCGCDGNTYENFGHLRTNGITQYIPGECKE